MVGNSKILQCKIEPVRIMMNKYYVLDKKRSRQGDSMEYLGGNEIIFKSEKNLNKQKETENASKSTNREFCESK